MPIVFFLKLLLLVAAIGSVFVGKKILHLKDDNLVEEVVEEVIKNKSGIDIDFTPNSPETGESFLKVKKISQTVVDNIDKI